MGGSRLPRLDTDEATGNEHNLETVPPPPGGDAYGAETVVREASTEILDAMRKPTAQERGGVDDERSARSVWQPSPELASAIRRERDSTRPAPLARLSEPPPLPQVGGLPLISFDEPDEAGATRLRPGLAQPAAPSIEETALYVPPPPPRVPKVSSAPPAKPQPRSHAGSVALAVFVLTLFILTVGTLIWRTLGWLAN
jgi:hypothetical protein